MANSGVFRHERYEVYQTALEFGRIAKRIEKRLPIHKHETKQMLVQESSNIATRIERAHVEILQSETYADYRLALNSTEQCHGMLDRLHMTRTGGFADVTAGLELLERLVAGLTDLLEQSRGQK